MFLWSFSVQQTTYRIGNHVYYMVEARSVNVKKTTTTHRTYHILYAVAVNTHYRVYEGLSPRCSVRQVVCFDLARGNRCKEQKK